MNSNTNINSISNKPIYNPIIVTMLEPIKNLSYSIVIIDEFATHSYKFSGKEDINKSPVDYLGGAFVFLKGFLRLVRR